MQMRICILEAALLRAGIEVYQRLLVIPRLGCAQCI